MAEKIDPAKYQDRLLLADTILSDVDTYCEKTLDDGHRRHLGASKIGAKCSRELWYGFRWVKREEYGKGTNRSAGQVLRLLTRGHREEHTFIEYLEGIGCVFDFTKEQQARITAVGGHFGGSLDNVGFLPPQYGIMEKVLFEFKTANTRNFNDLKKKGVREAQPTHWSQMCTYGLEMKLRFCLYICVHKDTDEWHVEFLELSEEHGKHMIDKAGLIITTRTPPAKFSRSPANFTCKWCSFLDVCHNGEKIDKNCRSCKNSVPSEDKKWVCEIAPPGNNVIPEDVIPVGCSSYTPVVDVNEPDPL